MSDYVTKSNVLSALGRFKENADDLYATNAEVTDVKNALNGCIDFLTISATFETGQFKANGQKDIYDTTRARTSYRIRANEDFDVSISTGFKFNWFSYDISTGDKIDNSSWLSSVTLPKGYDYNFAVKKESDATITPTEAQTALLIKEKAYSLKSESVSYRSLDDGFANLLDEPSFSLVGKCEQGQFNRYGEKIDDSDTTRARTANKVFIPYDFVITAEPNFNFNWFKYDPVTGNLISYSSWLTRAVLDGKYYYNFAFKKVTEATITPQDAESSVAIKSSEVIIKDGSIRFEMLDDSLQEMIENCEPTISSGLRTNVIFDTDWWTDIDDAVAIRCLSWGVKTGKINLLGVVLDAVNSTSVESISKMLDYEGIGNVDIGADKQATDYDGTPSYHSAIISNWNYCKYQSLDDVEDCVSFYRSKLANLGDGIKADIIIVGYLNAFSRLLQSSADAISDLTGIELVTAKVNKVWIMGGNYPSGSENNFNRTSRARQSANYVVSNCPVPITFLGYEVGYTVISGNTIKTVIGTYDLLYKALNAYGAGDTGRASWDPMTTILAIRGTTELAGYAKVKGTNSVDASTGANVFTESASGTQYYVVKKHVDNEYAYLINQILEKHGW